MLDFWTTVGLSALIATLASTALSFWSVARNIRQRAITEERQKWRDALRNLVPALVRETDKESKQEIRDSILLRLNPYKDTEAVQLMDRFLGSQSRDDAEFLLVHFQEMLKHDWERSKIEAGWCPLRADHRAKRKVNGQRRLVT